MQPNCILCKDMFYDIIQCQTTSELCRYTDLMHFYDHALLGHAMSVCYVLRFHS